jgi:hypothetical protein
MKKEKRADDNKVEYGTISLPIPLIEKVKERIKGTGMNSVSSYVAFILRQILSLENSKEVFTRSQEEEIRKRLDNLGY